MHAKSVSITQAGLLFCIHIQAALNMNAIHFLFLFMFGVVRIRADQSDFLYAFMNDLTVLKYWLEREKIE